MRRYKQHADLVVDNDLLQRVSERTEAAEQAAAVSLLAADYASYEDYLDDTMGDSLDRPPRCSTCDAVMVWEPDLVGVSCGGLALQGWWTCDAEGCEQTRLCRMSVPAEVWKVAGHRGVSVEVGTARIRIERAAAEVQAALAERIARLPELELEVSRLRAEVKRLHESTRAPAAAAPTSAAKE